MLGALSTLRITSAPFPPTSTEVGLSAALARTELASDASDDGETAMPDPTTAREAGTASPTGATPDGVVP